MSHRKGICAAMGILDILVSVRTVGEAKMQATLKQFPLISGTGLQELEAVGARFYGSCKLDAPRGSRAASFISVMNRCSLQHGALLFCSLGAALHAKLGPHDSYVVGFPISGVGEHTFGGTDVSVRGSAAISAIAHPGESCELRYKTRFDHYELTLSPSSLRRKLEALIGFAPVGPLTFAKRVGNHPEAVALRRLVLFLAEQLSEPTPPPRLFLAELEQAVLVGFLTSNESNFSATLSGDPRASGPWQVRRAEDYIAAHWDQPMTIEALAMATGVSARSLFHSFKKARGCSPMELIKQVRLQKAREMLSTPRADTSVTNIAYACGFGNLGHFANDYRLKFGERPSDTRRSAK